MVKRRIGLTLELYEIRNDGCRVRLILLLISQTLSIQSYRKTGEPGNV